MSNTARTVTLVLAAVAVAIGGFFVLRPGEDEEPTATTPPVTTPLTATATTTQTATTAVPKPKATRIALKGGAPVGGVERIEVEKGEVNRMTVSADTPEEIHVHGINIERDTGPGSPARFRFTADIEGRFEVEAHATGTQIAEITVNP